MPIKVDTVVSFEPVECYSCGVVFGIPYQLNINFRENKMTFYCPNGHGQAYVKSTADKLKDQLEEEKKKLANAQFELMAAKQRTEEAEKSKMRLQKRIKNGACPCCHRQFIQLSRHMKTKHPDYAEK
jgi:hypothetical protein